MPAQLLRKRRGTMYNIVGFRWLFPSRGGCSQIGTTLSFRYGVMHRTLLFPRPIGAYSLLRRPNIYFAGQITGVEGYVESAGSGLVAGINAALAALGFERIIFPEVTMLGAMAAYVSRGGASRFEPMNANFGLVPPLDTRIKNKQPKNEPLSARAREARGIRTLYGRSAAAAAANEGRGLREITEVYKWDNT